MVLTIARSNPATPHSPSEAGNPQQEGPVHLERVDVLFSIRQGDESIEIVAESLTGHDTRERMGSVLLEPSPFVEGAWVPRSLRIKLEWRRRGIEQPLLLVALEEVGRVHLDWERPVTGLMLWTWRCLYENHKETLEGSKVERSQILEGWACEGLEDPWAVWNAQLAGKRVTLDVLTEPEEDITPLGWILETEKVFQKGEAGTRAPAPSM